MSRNTTNLLRPVPTVRIWDIQERKGRGLPFIVRWKVSGQVYSRGFPTRKAARVFHRSLENSWEAGVRFSEDTGEPEGYAVASVTAASWAHTWFTRKTPFWAPKSRVAAAQSLGAVLPLMVKNKAPKPPVDISLQIQRWLADEQAMPIFLKRWSVAFADMTPQNCDLFQRRVLAIQVADRVARRTNPDAMKSIAASDIKRHNRTMRSMFAEAVSDGILPDQPWPTLRGRLDILTDVVEIDEAALPDPPQVKYIINAVRNSHPQSEGYQVLVSLIYYCGLRPSEALALSLSDLDLPDEGFGRARVRKAVKSTTKRWMTNEQLVFGKPKTGPRDVPIPPEVVERIRSWVGDRTTGLLVETKSGGPIGITNLDRAFRRVLRSPEFIAKYGERSWHPYDLRHAAATLWLKTGLDHKNVAKRMGHSPQILMAIYAGAFEGDEAYDNKRILAKLAEWD